MTAAPRPTTKTRPAPKNGRSRLAQEQLLRQRLEELGYATYGAYLKSAHWAAKKADLRRAGFASECYVCARTRGLNVHHRPYERLGRERLKDLVALCSYCHRDVHRMKGGDLRSAPDILRSSYRKAGRPPREGWNVGKGEKIRWSPVTTYYREARPK